MQKNIYLNKLPLSAKTIAVSKKQPTERVQALLDQGHRIYGENRVQEARVRWAESGWREQYSDLELHLIGPLQTNKVKDAVALFDIIHTIDRPKLAKALAAEMEKQNRHLPCFIQVNIGEEDQKSGVLPDDLDDLYQQCRDLGLNIIGLMCIPPKDEMPSPYFALLKKYADRLGLTELSMGMSADYEAAIACGATHLRIGSAVFGERPS